MSVFHKRVKTPARATVPKAVAPLLAKSNERPEDPKTDPFAACDSVSLRLTKFVRLGDATILRTAKDKRGGENEKEMKDPVKGREIDAVVSMYARGQQVFGTGEFQHPFLRPKKAVEFYAKLEGNLAINLAGGIMENANISVHPHFNAVRIPGSALKGIARHCARMQWKAEFDAENPEAHRTAADICAVFGYPIGDKVFDKQMEGVANESSGHVAFLEAYPDSGSELTADITTCHHVNYYKDDNSEAIATDNEAKINPVPFLSMKSGSNFRFILAPLRNATKTDMANAKRWLIEALTLYGAGAKTGAGYGWFSYDEDASEGLRNKHVTEEEDKKQKIQQAQKAANEIKDKQKKAENKKKREEILKGLTLPQRVRFLLDEAWGNPKQFSNVAAAFTDEEQVEMMKLFVGDEVFVGYWERIKELAGPKAKKKDRALYQPLEQSIRIFFKAHKAEIGGKLK